ncbi:uncharacterized protein LOC109414840 [Aedes albopictus]|uniref:SET domain-containing protein n=1 Tax=Aedes albopictus TaxID=7160 RepID=A0ABM1YRR1_AEDAL|nr:uncharacterized protein LOC109414840 [Aedes albopictus]
MQAINGLYEAAMGDVPRKLFEKIHSKAPHLRLRDVAAYRDYLSRYGPKVDVPERTKDNVKAGQCRLEGNQFYHKQMQSFALEKYIESVCWATEDSKDLGMAYANCSAVLFSAREYEFTLLAIALAKKHHYPDELMPKLLKRESECKLMIAGGHSGCRPNKVSPFKLNVSANPKIPFLADGITMKVLPGYGRSMVAERGFEAGDVILEEELTACSVNRAKKYLLCQCCAYTMDASPVPCVRCASVVYCSKECRQVDMKVVHRFECGIGEKLDHISYGAARIGVRMFFRGLTLFNDDVDKMMEFCKAHKRSGSDPFSLDYTRTSGIADEGNITLEEFKVFHQTSIPEINLKKDFTRVQAALYYLILMDHAPVASLFVTDAQKDFMLHCIHDYIRTALFLANLETQKLYTIAAICNHACIPNTFAITSDGRMVFVVLRRIQPNEQILTSYNIMHVEGDMGHDNPYARQLAMQFKCICPVCKPAGSRVANSNAPLPIPSGDVDELRRKLFGGDGPEGQLVTLRRFMQQYGHLHPDHPLFDTYIRKYRAGLMQVYLYYVDNAHRARAAIDAEVEEATNRQK